MTSVATGQLIGIVDDDPSILRMLARSVGAAGFEAACFDSAESFLASGIINETPCLILDVDLPGMSGIELQQHLAELRPKVAVIMISGKSTEETQQRALSAGAIAFLNKPFNIDSLLAAIRSVDSLSVN